MYLCFDFMVRNMFSRAEKNANIELVSIQWLQKEFGQFIPLFLADHLKLCQIGWEASVNCYLQVSLQMFCGVYDWALAGPLKDSQEASPCMTCCMLWVIAVLKVAQIWCVHRFSSRTFLYLAAFITPLILTSLPVPATVKHQKAWCCHHHGSL